MASGLLLTLVLTLGSDLETARQAFELGQCEKVTQGLSAGVKATRSRAGKGELYRLAAVCHFRSKRLAQADHLARAALRLAPGQGLDPFLNPPAERAWFDALVKEVPPPQPTVVERVVRVVSHVRHYRCVAPFGYCHWSHGNLETGLTVGGIQLAGLGLNVFSWWMAEQQRDPLGGIPENRVDELQRWTYLQYTGAVLGAGALAVDMWLGRKERRDALPQSP